MKKLLLLHFITLLFLNNATAQNNKHNNTIAISIPAMFGNSAASYQILGNKQNVTGTATGFGLNLNYAKNINNHLFFVVGAGYYKQKFNIERPINLTDTLTRLLYISKWYEYDNIDYIAGIGYNKQLSKNLTFKFEMDYHLYQTFKQTYKPTYWNNSTNYQQVNNKNFIAGNAINLQIGLAQSISPHVGIGLAAVVPILIKWNNDAMFFADSYFSDSQQIARNKFFIGTAISCNYHF